MTLRVTLEIVPFGVEAEKYTINTLEIYNTGNIGFGLCSYEAKLISDGGTELQKVVGIEHLRQDGAMSLARKVLEFLE